MKILAVSDASSPGLESLISCFPEKLKGLDLILSCGDLEREYLEFLVDGLSRELFFVCGNHQAECHSEALQVEEPLEKLWAGCRTLPEKREAHIGGGDDLHGRVMVHGDYLVVGFGGSLWYGGRGNEYHEKEMARVVNGVIRKIQLYRFQEMILGRGRREIIVVSHAPVFQVHDEPDQCHTGFRCFRDFVERTSPVLWVHGHVHLQDVHQNQVTVLGRTTIVNAFGYKFINLEHDRLEVSYRYDILDK